MSTLLDDQEIKEIQKKYIEYGMEWPGYNCDEYKDIEDYKEKLKKNLDAYETVSYTHLVSQKNIDKNRIKIKFLPAPKRQLIIYGNMKS